MQGICDHSHVVMNGLEHDISESEQTDDEVMELVVFQKELLKIVGCYFVGRIPDLNDLLQI